MPLNFLPMDANKIDKGKEVAAALHAVLQAHGQPDSKLALMLLQVAHETGGFDSHVSQVNNMTGIKYNPKGRLVDGEYDSGIKSPEGNNYSGFNSLESWANRYYGIITRGKNNPLAANTVDEFADRLKANGYFTASLQSYKAALKKWIPTLKKNFSSLSFPVAASGGLVLLILIVSLYLINQK